MSNFYAILGLFKVIVFMVFAHSLKKRKQRFIFLIKHFNIGQQSLLVLLL